MNDESSRSHLIISICIEVYNKENETVNLFIDIFKLEKSWKNFIGRSCRLRTCIKGQSKCWVT